MKQILLLIILLIASITDIKIRKIPNFLILIGILLGSFVKIYENSFINIYDSLIDMLIPMIILYILFYFKCMGAGDIKLYSFVGFLMGRDFLFLTITLSFVMGAFYAMYVFIKDRVLLERGEYVLGYVFNMVMHKKLIEYDIKNAPKINFAPFIALSGIVSLFVENQGFM